MSEAGAPFGRALGRRQARPLRGAVAIAVAAATLLLASARQARAAPSVWVIDDGEKIKEDATSLPFESGAGNPVWAPGAPVRLFALRNEAVALQVVVEAGDEALDAVTVDLVSLAAATARIENAPDATDPTRFVGRRIESFVEYFLIVARASGGKTQGESIGWSAGSGPARGQWTGRVPDALIPVEAAPPWAPYPMRVAPRTNGVVWIDVTVPKTQTPGTYVGDIVVRSAAREIATIRVELEVEDIVLPDHITNTMLFYDRAELDRTTGGGDAAEEHLWQLLHRHRIAPMHAASTPAEIDRQARALDGSEYLAERGYEGPGEGVGDGVLALGAYGSLGPPTPKTVALVEQMADRLAPRVLAQTDAFVYAVDEDCASPLGRDWKRALASSADANVKRLRVGWTCSEAPAEQPVDIPIVLGPLDTGGLAEARARGKEVWVYNGVLPHEGTFLTDAPAVSPRVNGWLGGMFDIGRWFYWESTFWYDDNRGGHGAYDPFATAETFHNADGDYCMGDGVLVYPGKQVDAFESHSLGIRGVVASIRLKNWRRGIEDVGYYWLARSGNAAKADAIAKQLLPAAFGAVKAGDRPSFTDSGKPFFDARRALLALIPRGQDGGGAMRPVPHGSAPVTQPRGRCGCPVGCATSAPGAFGGATPFALALTAFALRRRSSRRAAARCRGAVFRASRR